MTPHPEPRIMTTADIDVGPWMENVEQRLGALERVQRDAETGEFREPSALERALTDSVVVRTHERDEAYRNNAVLSEQRDKACRLLDGEQRNHNVTIKRVRDVTAERDAARVALRDLRSIVQLARDDLDIAQAGSETTPFARHDLLTYVATAYDRLDAALASATPAEGGS